MQLALNAILASLRAFMVHEQRQAFFKGRFSEVGIGRRFLQFGVERLEGHLSSLVVIDIPTHPPALRAGAFAPILPFTRFGIQSPQVNDFSTFSVKLHVDLLPFPWPLATKA